MSTFEDWWRIYSSKFPGAPGIFPGPHETALAAWRARRGVFVKRDIIEKILDILPPTAEGFEIWMELLQTLQDSGD